MKAAEFEYARPNDLREAARLLEADERAKIIAGGQSLAPMLNLRLATPALLVDVRSVTELKRSDDNSDAVTLGACVTHASIEDERVPDATRGIMSRVARGIAYRAVRNRGTLGGSLAHADPSADWIVTLCALNAEVLVFSARGTRSTSVAQLIVGPFETSLAPDEIIEAVRIPKVSRSARWGYCKVSRKAGKFAEAMSAVLWDPERDVRRAVMGAMVSKPVVIEDPRPILERDDAGAQAMLCKMGLAGDRHAIRVHLVALRRAFAQVGMK